MQSGYFKILLFIISMLFLVVSVITLVIGSIYYISTDSVFMGRDGLELIIYGLIGAGYSLPSTYYLYAHKNRLNVRPTQAHPDNRVSN